MNRITAVGLCLAATFAFAAVVASTAMATETAEYGQCRAQKKGEYTDGSCTTESSKPGKGEYEWYPGAPAECIAQKKGEYTDSSCAVKSAKAHKGEYEKEPGPKFTGSTGVVTFETPALGGPWGCEKSRSSGEITGVKTAAEVMVFEECSFGKRPCQSPGDPSGTISTEALETTILGHEDTGLGSGRPAVGEVWTQISGVGGGTSYSALFECTGVGKFRVFGWVDAKTTTPNSMGTSFTFEFANGIGEIGVLLTEAETGSGWGPAGGGKTIDTYHGTNTTEAKVEIRDI